MTVIGHTTPHEERKRRARILWDAEGRAYHDCDEELGHEHARTPRYWAKDLGFRKINGTSIYSHAPCIDCLIPLPVERLEERRCTQCRQPTAEIRRNPPGWRPMADMDYERREHRKRMRERERGERPPLPKPCVIKDAAGRPLRAPRRRP